jgi:hypothetical protein
MHLCILDPTNVCGCQTRPRPYFVFVQSALHARRGRFDVPIPLSTGCTPQIMQYLSPAADLPIDDLRDLHQRTRCRDSHDHGYGDAHMEYTCRTGPSTVIKAYLRHCRPLSFHLHLRACYLRPTAWRGMLPPSTLERTHAHVRHAGGAPFPRRFHRRTESQAHRTRHGWPLHTRTRRRGSHLHPRHTQADTNNGMQFYRRHLQRT